MSSPPHVALVVETSIVYGRRLLAGVTRYLRSHRPWSVFLEQREYGAAPPDWLAGWKGDGLIFRTPTTDLVRRTLRRGVACVSLYDGESAGGLPRIRSDHHAIGRLAAEHLLERGFRHFAYCGFSEQHWAAERRAGFLAGLSMPASEVAMYESPWYGPRSHPWEREQQAIGKWLAKLPRPVGLMACNDMRGQHVLDSCQRAGVAVPEEVAVVGVDDDDLLCDLCSPPLSSVAPNPELLGYEAAALLESLMAGYKADPLERTIPPLGLTTRQSTDVLAIDDPSVAAAVRLIRERACNGITVSDILREVPVSRSVLERLFRRHLGLSPQAEIRAVRIKRVKQLLVETDLTLDRVAELSGFAHPEYLSVAFLRDTGQTPGRYRASAQGR
ncbi:MAG: XylR family transcriptional regulator [Planctomycetaceae bacterium]|nr:XylR family transcriptional regulator [Planctomycetaceae bacterium]